MNRNSKLFICKEIIQYFLDSTNYNLKTIADLTNTSITKIRGIYYGDEFPKPSTEIQLITMYQIIREFKIKDKYENVKY